MFKFKTEMHCHTAESSNCGKIPAKDIVDAYIKAGYDTLIITDHFGAKCSSADGIQKDVDKLLLGYNEAKKAADGRINLLFAIELNFHENANDYLVYGITEDFLRKTPDIYNLGIEKFSGIAQQNGFLVYQAHPFRNKMTVTYPGFIYGIESFNAHPRHDSRNSIAKAWAELYNLKTISGSDCHQIPDIARSGILTEKEIKTIDDLLKVLKNDEYELITL